MISVIVPTHNRLELLRKKLELLEAQQGEFEVIVVADGCTDGTAQFLRQYQPPFGFQRLETAEAYGRGKGPAFARNRGAEAAKGEILLFSDDDVMPQAGWIEAHQKAHAQAGIVAVGKLVLPPSLSEGATFAGPMVAWWNPTGANTSLPKALFEQVGGYDESFSGYGGEDPDLGYRLKQAGARFVFAPQAVGEHWDTGYKNNLLQKARQAGQAHMRVWQKYKDSRIAWALGIHPILLSLKMALLPSIKGFLGTKLDGELAYCWGAWEAYEELKGRG